jgi:Zn ribbon nucleic-acid-binding protein
MSFPKNCPYCGADKEDLLGWIKNDYVKKWECKKCGKRWDRGFEMSGKNYYKMLENVHVIFSKEETEEINFWRGESYKKFEFDEAGLNLELLLEKKLCKVDILDAYDSDFITQLNGEKRAIAKNLLRKYLFMSVQEVAETTRLPIEQVIKLEREVRKNEYR